MNDYMDTSSTTIEQRTTHYSSITDVLSRDPANWLESDVVTWLNHCKLEQYASVFQENEIDGSVLMNNDFDDAKIKELIPKMKHRLLFIEERRKLRGKEPIAPEPSMMNIVKTSKELTQLVEVSAANPLAKFVDEKPYFLVRTGTKARCSWKDGTRNILPLDIADLLQPQNMVHTLPISNVLDAEAMGLLTKIFGYLRVMPQSDELDSDFNVLIDEPINSEILLQDISHSRSLKPYILDSFKRYHSLYDIMSALSSCLSLTRNDSSADAFLEIVEQITKYVVLVCTIESLSPESQRFLGNMIRKNGLPVPLSYYVPGESAVEFKINFNLLAETSCFSKERIALCLGSPLAIGLGKTSVLPYLFENIRGELLNTEGNTQFRSSCIDIIFGSLTKNDTYLVFDVHGSMTTMNEDLITAIQQYSVVQILFITEADLHNKDFLLKMMNYSIETRTKPTIVVVFNPKYGEKNNSFSRETFEQVFGNENWQNTICTTAPILSKVGGGSKFNEERRLQCLRQTFVQTFDSLSLAIRDQPHCESIFAIEAHFLTIQSTSSAPPPSIYTFEIVETLDSLFGRLSDKTNNLKLVTPISYLESSKLKCEKQLSELWDGPSGDLNTQLEEIQKEYQCINCIPEYATFFIDLLTKHPYIELLITERYLEQWRAQYESPLCSQLKTAKNNAMTIMSRIKHLEEQCQQYIDSNNQEEVENTLNQTQMIKDEYKAHQNRILEIEGQLCNIDLTIGLFCDEIFALYEHFPKLFESNNLTEKLAKTFAELMYKGFSFHILRGRPLRCHNKLIQLSLKYVHPSTNETSLVLTVIGEQSSAKSSLMNATFGCNFRVSAGRCTIGMYLSVVRWHSHTIIILDTEGLLSLEESGSIFDNQMVSMAMLSSHLVLINHKGEFSSNLEHLIGMSFYAKLQIRSPLKPKLLFVLRDQTDTTATEIFFRQLAKLKENLYKDSKFLKSSIDDELEIDGRNVILLPNAFSSDHNTILNVEQTWRNRIFPMKINDLRRIILTSLIDSSNQVYLDVPQLYHKISTNWDAIDKLGPNLLACKTLCELSIMNELRDLTREIISNGITAVNDEGRQNIDNVLSSITHENCADINIAHLSNQFNAAMQLTHEKITQKAFADFRLTTERSCYPPEFKHKVEKIIEPQVLNMQGMLREEFDDRLYKARRNARISNAQHRLIDAAQAELNNNINLNAEELQERINRVYIIELDTCKQNLRSEFATSDQITTMILKFYNSDFSTKAGNSKKGSIYNLLRSLEINQFRSANQNLEEVYQCVMRYKECQHHPNTSWLSRIKAFFGLSAPDRQVENVWHNFYLRVEYWFHDKQASKNNKNFLFEIINILLSQLRRDVIELVHNQFSSSSSDPGIIAYMFNLVENLYNHELIQRKKQSLELHIFLFDVVVIALRILIDKIIEAEQRRHETAIEKAQNDIKAWRESITTQINHMKNSLEQGRNMANIVNKVIFKEISRILLDKILHDITEDIGKSHFINHEAVQKQAYEESFRQGNGEKILKYVLNINRYFLELSLREISTRLEGIIYMHIQNVEQTIMQIIHKVNDTAQQTKHENVRLIANEIEEALFAVNTSMTTTDNKFALDEIMSVPIQDLLNFKIGFKTLLNSISSIHGRIAQLTQDVRKNAYIECKIRMARRLGCQSRCPGCGSKCGRPEPHEEELVEQWPKCECTSGNCTCKRSQPSLFTVHGTSHHVAEAFYGSRYYKSKTPFLQLCYQNWMTSGVQSGNNEYIRPLRKYYNQYHPKWYSNLHELSTTGDACDEIIPPSEQRRGWMIVRDVLVSRYASEGMIDEESYDEKLYPSNVVALSKDFKVKWNDENDESSENDDNE